MARRPAVLITVALAALAGPARADAPPACEAGAYQGPSGDFVVVSEAINAAKQAAWRYAFRDGRFGAIEHGPLQCARGAVSVAWPGKPAERWPRMALRSTTTRFRSGGVTLVGELIEPPAGRGAPPPLVVLVHGSESTPYVGGHTRLPYLFAAQGIAAFVFDKRGTGASGGAYTQNFSRLADDVVAASAEARRLARGRYRRFGLYGGSQGGWVAPHAANAAGADFVVVGFGLVLTPLEEDAEQVATELRAHGYGDDVLGKARKVTDATGAVMASHFTAGYDALAAVRAAYGTEPWFAQIRGEFTGDVLAGDEAALRRDGRAKYDNLDIEWRYDAIGELRKVQAPQLWVLAGADHEAPPALTLARLQGLRREGRPLELAVFPDTDHGIQEFVEAPDGTRTMTRVADGYFRITADWIKREQHPPYGRAIYPAP